jgi:hypothetical protein
MKSLFLAAAGKLRLPVKTEGQRLQRGYKREVFVSDDCGGAQLSILIHAPGQEVYPQREGHERFMTFLIREAICVIGHYRLK